MKINLAEIPEDGRSYQFTNQTGELNAILSDLIGKNQYVADFFIKPLNSRDFEFSGKIETKTPGQCSRCGIDFAFPIKQKFREFLIPKQNQPRGSRYSKVNHVSDLPEDAPEVSEYEGNAFDLGEYIHEVIALAAPFNVAGPEDENGDCSICKIPLKGQSFSYDEQMPPDKPQNPFAVLKNIKTN